MNFKDITLADVSVEAKVETLGVVLDKKLSEIDAQVSTVTKLVGPQGPKGDKGDRGEQGVAGKAGIDGKNGKDGLNGKDGVDGKDGQDGISVVDVNIAADNSLVVTLSNGDEIDAGSLDVLGVGKGNSYSTVMRTNEVPVYAVRYDQVSDTVSYRGEAGSGLPEDQSVWRIQKIVVDGDDVTITWANGNTAFGNKWTDRLSLNYS